MEKIVFEVDDRLAKAWCQASLGKKEINNKISVCIGKNFLHILKKTFSNI